MKGQSQKDKNKGLKYLTIKVILGTTPIIIILGLLILFISSTGMYFSNNLLSGKLTNAENSALIDKAKLLTDDLSKEMKDHYGTDKRFKLQYQYILSYVKYLSSLEDSLGNEGYHTVNSIEEQIKKAIDILKPKFSYKKDKIITIKEYKVKINKFDIKKLSEIKVVSKKPEKINWVNLKKIYVYEDNLTIEKNQNDYKETIGVPEELKNIKIYNDRPAEFDPSSYKPGDKIFIIEEQELYVCNEYEEVKTERNEEEACFLTRVKTIMETFDIIYNTKTDIVQKNDEKITITKPVITEMKQIDKNWDGLKKIVASTCKDEDINSATEVILASAASYINEDVTEEMIFTGGCTGAIPPENFTGGQAEFIEKVSNPAIESYKKYNVLPSITIAQAILESAWGKSGLTKKANNLFGIKAFGWKGGTIDMLTAEYKSDGSKYYITASFRAYNSWGESIEDHSRVLMQKNYMAVRDATNYQDAAKALRDGGYATDPSYPQLIISIIERYGLYIYDK